jgi:iron complex transport system substrate-binding protein
LLWKDARVRSTKYFSTFLLLASMLLFTSSCAVDSAGSDVKEISSAEMITLENQSVVSDTRIAAVGNGVAEILLAMGLKNLIVGRDIASEIDQLKDLPIVTNGHDLSAEKILAVRPSLLIVDPNTSPRSAINQISRSGVKVIEAPESYSVKAIAAKIDLIAQTLGIAEVGRSLNQRIESELAEVSTKQGNPPARVLFLYLRGSNGIFLVGGPGSGADALLSAAGAEDLGSTIYKNPFTPINSEAILGLKPDRYLLMSAGLASVGGVEAFRKLPGIDPNVPVITVDDSLLLSFGPRTPDLIRQLNEAIYDNG